MKKIVGKAFLWFILWCIAILFCPNSEDPVIMGYAILTVPALFFTHGIIKNIVRYVKGHKITRSLFTMFIPLTPILAKPSIAGKSVIALQEGNENMNQRGIMILNIVGNLPCIVFCVLFPLGEESNRNVWYPIIMFTFVLAILCAICISTYYYVKNIRKSREEHNNE